MLGDGEQRAYEAHNDLHRADYAFGYVHGSPFARIADLADNSPHRTFTCGTDLAEIAAVVYYSIVSGKSNDAAEVRPASGELAVVVVEGD